MSNKCKSGESGMKDDKDLVVMITGVQGMDGSTLADIYLKRGCKVVGLDLWKATGIYPNIKDAMKHDNFIFETGDISEHEFMYRIFKKYKPDLFYNMGAVSLVPESFKIPGRVLKVNTIAVLNILEIIKEYSPKTRFYQASSSEQIGDNKEPNQNADSRMLPNSPYAISKMASFFFTRLYRNVHGLFCVNGMLWNHEGPRRGPNFVTRKITKGIARMVTGKQDHLELGNINTFRDWGLSQDYCEAMVLMMESGTPDDYSVSTGETHSVKEFVEHAFKCVGVNIEWKGEGTEEKGYFNGMVLVSINPKFYRPVEVELLHGDYSKIKNELGWEPVTKFAELVEIMMENDLNEECE